MSKEDTTGTKATATNKTAVKKATSPSQGDGKKLLTITRHNTKPGTHPYDQFSWESRDVVMKNWRDGSINFEQLGVEFPTHWSENATSIVTSKYFRGKMGSPEREGSLKQVIDRVVDTYAAAAVEYGYMDKENASIFSDELKYALVDQQFAFNSPVWFNVGTKAPQQISACQPYHSLVSTPSGLIPIGKLVENNAVGLPVYDANGLTKILAVKNNGTKEVFRITTKAGHQLDVTGDHLVWKATSTETGRFVPAYDLAPGDQLSWHRTGVDNESTPSHETDLFEAALAGWMQSDGFVGRYTTGNSRSLTMEAMTVNDDELEWVQASFNHLFANAHRKERLVVTKDKSLDCHRTRMYGNHMQPFIDKYGLMVRGVDMVVPESMFTAPLDVVANYIKSIFQAEGYISLRENASHLAFAMISEDLVRGVQKLLLRFGIFSRVTMKVDPRENRHNTFELHIGNEGDRRLFAENIGFISKVKRDKLKRSFEVAALPANKRKTLSIDSIESIGFMPVYDIQTESGEYLSENLRVHNCFILAVEDSMASILNWYVEEGLVFKGGSGAGVNLSNIRSSREHIGGGGHPSGPVSFMRGADASAGTIKSGGASRRAAKMVILDVDHPDILEFIQTKSLEENKIRALRDAGFDMDMGGKDINSVQFQNANNSVRVNDEFMKAVISNGKWNLTSRTTGEVVETVNAAELWNEIAKAAWECADPGVQYDDAIQDWHTLPNSGRITASNPCFPADQRVVTDKGLVKIGDLVARSRTGERFKVYTNDVTNELTPNDSILATSPLRYMENGVKEILELHFSDGSRIRATSNHRLWTKTGWVRAEDLTENDLVIKSINIADRSEASGDLSYAVDAANAAANTAAHQNTLLPTRWNSELAHYLGWLVGDGCVTSKSAVTVYGSQSDKDTLTDRHSKVIESITGRYPKSVLTANGTSQLRLGHTAFREYLKALGFSAKKAQHKVVPEAVFQAPHDAVVNFLQGLFDADGCVVNQEVKGTRYVGLSSRSQELLLGVQELLASLGINARIYTGKTKKSAFSYIRKDGSEVNYQSDGPSHDLRISGASIKVYRDLIGFSLPEKSAKLDNIVANYEFYEVENGVTLRSRKSIGEEMTYNLTEPRNHSYIVSGVVVANCSEYMSLDNSSCNLASIRLTKFFNPATGQFDVAGFSYLTGLITTAMDISISFADFPTEKIGEVTKDIRTLGLGFTDLGAMLMSAGAGYDSELGRLWAAAITALMSGVAYETSSKIAEVVGSFEYFDKNKAPMVRVLGKHDDAVSDTRKTLDALDSFETSLTGNVNELLDVAQDAWSDAYSGAAAGYMRNAQISVVAPTGTISFFLDADTTGIEPDLGLVKYKKLSSGGSLQIVNQMVPIALERLGYTSDQITGITAHILETGQVLGAPGFNPVHTKVFATAMGTNVISPDGHIKMMAAVQPFISGAQSKTINLPFDATVEDVAQVYLDSWKLGLKAVAIYRDGCKVGQPMTVKGATSAAVEEIDASGRSHPRRYRLPRTRESKTTSFSVAGAEGYITVGTYDDGTPGEVFIRMSKQGSTLSGVMDALAISISIGLQHGVPIETLISKFINSRFEPSGMTDDEDIRIASSILDYIARRLALDYLEPEQREVFGVKTTAERTADLDSGSYGKTVEIEPAAPKAKVAERPSPEREVRTLTFDDTPLCMTCGNKMRRAGSCYVCESCGNTTGCS